MNIKWYEGNMYINEEVFFPCTKDKMKILLKVIEMDYEHHDELIRYLKNFFEEWDKKIDESIKETGKECLDLHQELVDMKNCIESRRHPNGVPLTPEELEKLKSKSKDKEIMLKNKNNSFESKTKLQKRLWRNMNFLKTKKGQYFD